MIPIEFNFEEEHYTTYSVTSEADFMEYLKSRLEQSLNKKYAAEIHGKNVYYAGPSAEAKRVIDGMILQKTNNLQTVKYHLSGVMEKASSLINGFTNGNASDSAEVDIDEIQNGYKESGLFTEFFYFNDWFFPIGCFKLKPGKCFDLDAIEEVEKSMKQNGILNDATTIKKAYEIHKDGELDRNVVKTNYTSKFLSGVLECVTEEKKKLENHQNAGVKLLGKIEEYQKGYIERQDMNCNVTILCDNQESPMETFKSIYKLLDNFRLPNGKEANYAFQDVLSPNPINTICYLSISSEPLQSHVNNLRTKFGDRFIERKMGYELVVEENGFEKHVPIIFVTSITADVNSTILKTIADLKDRQANYAMSICNEYPNDSVVPEFPEEYMHLFNRKNIGFYVKATEKTKNVNFDEANDVADLIKKITAKIVF